MLAVPCARNSTVGSSPPQACQLKQNSDQLRCRATFFIGKNDNFLSWLFAGSLLCAFGITLSAFMPNLEVMFFTLGRRLTQHLLPCQPSCWALYPPPPPRASMSAILLSSLPTHHLLPYQPSCRALYPPTTCWLVSNLVELSTHPPRAALLANLFSALPTCDVLPCPSYCLALYIFPPATCMLLYPPSCWARLLRSYPPATRAYCNIHHLSLSLYPPVTLYCKSSPITILPYNMLRCPPSWCLPSGRIILSEVLIESPLILPSYSVKGWVRLFGEIWQKLFTCLSSLLS